MDQYYLLSSVSSDGKTTQDVNILQNNLFVVPCRPMFSIMWFSSKTAFLLEKSLSLFHIVTNKKNETSRLNCFTSVALWCTVSNWTLGANLTSAGPSQKPWRGKGQRKW